MVGFPFADCLQQLSIINLGLTHWSITLEFWAWGRFGSVLKVKQSLLAKNMAFKYVIGPFAGVNSIRAELNCLGGHIEYYWQLSVKEPPKFLFLLTYVSWRTVYFFQMTSFIFSVHFGFPDKLRDGRRWTPKETAGWES